VFQFSIYLIFLTILSINDKLFAPTVSDFCISFLLSSKFSNITAKNSLRRIIYPIMIKLTKKAILPLPVERAASIIIMFQSLVYNTMNIAENAFRKLSKLILGLVPFTGSYSLLSLNLIL
jgi:hypothetical protein